MKAVAVRARRSECARRAHSQGHQEGVSRKESLEAFLFFTYPPNPRGSIWA